MRKKSGKKPGGQAGHEGFTLKQVERPDHVVRCPVIQCENCKANLTARKNDAVEQRQVVDLPPITSEATEYQADVKDCPCCGTRNIGEFPINT